MVKAKKTIRPPRFNYTRISRAILGTRYELSVVSVSTVEAQKLNKKYRKKSYVPDILAFPLSATEGEIVLNDEAIIREAKKRQVGVADYAAYIFVHGCLHLKGFDHGESMSVQEKKYIKKLRLKDISDVL